MANRPANTWIGGDSIKQQKITEALKKLEVDVDTWEVETMTMEDWMSIPNYDIIHIWNFSMPWSKLALYAGAKQGKKVVASMIYHATEAFIPYNLQQVMMDNTAAAIYETESEVDRVRLHLTPKNTFIVPNGVDAWWFEPNTGKVPFKTYVLTVGRIEPNKGQLKVSEACRELGITYVCIGEVADERYSKMCLSQGAILYPSMKQEDLKRWYANCTVYAQVSKNETWGMAVDEAGTQGVNLLLSTGFERHDIPDAVYCEYDDIKSVTENLQKAISQERQTRFRNLLKKRTWKKVSEEYLEIYKKILKI